MAKRFKFKMSKKGLGPNVTLILIGLAIFIMIFVLGTDFYVNLMANNGGSVDTAYTTQYAKIANYSGDLEGFNTDVNNRSLWTTVPALGESTFNVFIIGLGGVAKMFDFIAIAPSLLNTITDGLGIPAIVLSMLTVAIGIFLIMRLAKAARNANEVV